MGGKFRKSLVKMTETSGWGSEGWRTSFHDVVFITSLGSGLGWLRTGCQKAHPKASLPSILFP